MLKNDGTGSFTAGTTGIGSGAGPGAITAADLDRDGDLDLATANYYSNDVSVLENDGTGSFTAVTTGIGGAEGPRAITVGDLEGDGDLDLATANNSDNVSVLLNDHGAVDAPAVSLNPIALEFGEQAVGSASGAQTVTVANSGNAALAISTVTVTGANPGDFSISSDGCASTAVAPGADCALSIAFAPTTTGPRRATLTIADNAAGSPHTVPLSGGIIPPAPAVALDPASVGFGDQAVGSSSGAQRITVSNSGHAVLEISTVTVTGANPGDFSISSDGCASTAVAPGAGCAVSIGFAPTTTGPRRATLTIADNAAGSPHTLALTGTGVAVADVGVSIGATPNPVRSGKTLTYTITVTNHGPSSATGVALTSALPAESKFVSYTPADGTTCKAPAPGATGTLTCELGPLRVGSASTEIVVKVIAPGGPSVTNTATVTSTSSDPEPANDSATVKTAVFGRR